MTRLKAVVPPQRKSNAKRIRAHQRQADSNQKRLQQYQEWVDSQRSDSVVVLTSKKRRYRAIAVTPIRREDSPYEQQIERLGRFSRQFSQAHKPAIRLKLLREMAELKYSTVQSKLQPLIRKEFDENKRKWFKLNGVCAVCNKQPEIRHHIVQIQNGGLNNPKNVMLLCNPCHAAIHPWLNK